MGWLVLVVALAAIACDRNATNAPAAVASAAERAVLPAERASRRPVQLVRQRKTTDCGVAALTMTLNSYGRLTTLEELGRDMPHDLGITALDIVRAAEQRGLGVRGYRPSAEQLPGVLVSGDILHLRASHFVVFDRVTEHGIYLVDPAAGVRVVSLEQIGREYSGVALLFARDPSALDQRLATTQP